MNRYFTVLIASTITLASLYTIPALAEAEDQEATGCRPAARQTKGRSASMQHHKQRGQMSPLCRCLSRLDLTDKQLEQIKPIVEAFNLKVKERREQMKDSCQSLLTPEQRTAQKSRDKSKRPKLTEAQKEQMKAYAEQNKELMKKDLAAAQAQMKPILTDEQNAKLAELLAKPPKMHSPRSHKGHRGDRLHDEAGPEMRHKHLTRELSLTEEQSQKLDPILSKYESEKKSRHDAVRQADQKSLETMRAELEKILTPEQLKKFDSAMQPQRGPRHHGPKHHGPRMQPKDSAETPNDYPECPQKED